MALILSLETSTTVCSVALHKQGVLLDTLEDHTPNSHSALLTVLMENILKKQKLEVNELDAIAVSIGPGSYTGLRIGASVAKGLAYGAEIPVIAIPTLKVIASALSESGNEIDDSALICPMIDARRMEVYSAIYSQSLEAIEDVAPKIVDGDSYKDILDKNKIYFCGNGSQKCKEVILNNNAIFIDDIYPSAKMMGKLVYEKFQNKEFEDVAYFEPFYLKSAAVTVPKSVF